MKKKGQSRCWHIAKYSKTQYYRIFRNRIVNDLDLDIYNGSTSNVNIPSKKPIGQFLRIGHYNSCTICHRLLDIRNQILRDLVFHL